MTMKKTFFFIITMFASTHGYSSEHNVSTFTSDNLALTLGSTGALATIGYISYQYAMTPAYPIITVQQLDAHAVNFPKNFVWGVATASTQNEESSNNNSWAPKNLTAQKRSDLADPGHACKSWTMWKDDIDKVAYLGANAYRLSIEWSRVQPSADHFDHTGIEHYVEICKMLQEKGIAPMICLHHYSDPIWFLKIGGFSKEENIKLFTKFCEKMYEALRPYVADWIVISQPAAYAIKGYSQGMQPPFIKDAKLADIVMLNMFKAHIDVYDIMHNSYKKSGKGLQPNVGICHQITQMQAYTAYNPLEHLVANFADRLYNKALLRFFTDGHFRTLTPMIDIAYLPQAPDKFDFFALSYYSPKSFSGITPVTPFAEPSHQSADQARIIDKQGMYNAIVQASKLRKPVYVVESGINPVDENQRVLLLNSYLSAIAQALIDGYDVRGYYHWTLMDNYEWGMPQNATHFGLYKNRVVNEDGGLDSNFKNHESMLKDGGKYYKNIISQQKNTPRE